MKAITFLIFLLLSTLITFLVGSISIKKLFIGDHKEVTSEKLNFEANDDFVASNPKLSDENDSNNLKLDKEKQNFEENVLSVKDEVLTEEITPTVVVALSPTNTPTIKPSPTLTPTPKISMQIPDFTSEQIYNLINSYSGKFGVDPNVIRHVALCESGFNPKAKNWIYGGLFQFSPTTWETWRRKMNQDSNTDLRYHAEEAIETATYAISLNKGSMWPNCMP